MMKTAFKIVAIVIGSLFALAAALFVAYFVYFSYFSPPVELHGEFVNRTELPVEEVVLVLRKPIGRMDSIAPGESRTFRFATRGVESSLIVTTRLQGGEFLSLDCAVYIVDGVRMPRHHDFTFELVDDNGPVLTCLHEGETVTSAGERLP